MDILCFSSLTLDFFNPSVILLLTQLSFDSLLSLPPLLSLSGLLLLIVVIPSCIRVVSLQLSFHLLLAHLLHALSALSLNRGVAAVVLAYYRVIII